MKEALNLNNTYPENSESKYINLEKKATSLVEIAFDEMSGLKSKLSENISYKKNIKRITQEARLNAQKEINKGLDDDEIVSNIKIFLIENLPNDQEEGEILINEARDFLGNLSNDSSELLNKYNDREGQDKLIQEMINYRDTLPDSEDGEKIKLEISKKLRWFEDIFNFKKAA